MQPSGITVQPTFQRWINTLPFWLGLGVAIYFQLPHEPPMWLLAGLLVFLLLLWVTKVNQRLFAITLVVTIVACGVGAGIVQTDRVGGPVLKKPLNAVMLEGRVRDIVIDGKRQKMTLDSLRIDGLAPEETPLKIRVSAALGAQEIGIGQFISLRGWLAPPSRPVMPGGFDFGRFFYFRQIGAIGFVIPPVQVLPASQHEPHWQTYLSDWMAKERLRLKRYFVEVLPEPSSSLTVAYVIGDSSGISEEIQNNMRAAGLSHIIAISGMHLTIVCGFIYFLVRLILALIPWIATRADIRKPAAWLALLSGILYLWLADFPISAVRAYVMIAIYFSAILLGREADGLRSLALAAIVILLVQPSSLLEPGFQLSFAAVLALILYYRWWAKRRETEFWEKSSWLRHMGIYFLGIAATSLVAGLATAPIAAYHFHQFASYGLLANMLCIPLVSFIVTPAL
ncbi:MAG: ComEC/Rec2 family competence protein, partial [Rickettsiales bacterium]|nr:ComEC/Rec2 family competence protein [Rickettsiales bacterium]